MDELAAVVAYAHATSRRVTALGSGHSFTDVGRPDEVAIDCSALEGLIAFDRATSTIRVRSGTTLHDLNSLLLPLGVALPNLGDVAYQTVGGAISTGTHGTGLRHRGIADQVLGLTLVDGAGRIVELQGEDATTASVGLGALGVVTEYTLRVVPTFRLRAVEEPMRLDTVLEGLDQLVEGSDFLEFYWVPHTRWALTKRNQITDDAPSPPSRIEHFRQRILLENVAFGALCAAGSAFPRSIPRLATVLPSAGRREWVDHSHRVFTSPRWVKFTESEWAIPRAALQAALADVRSMIERRGFMLNIPVEIRFGAAERTPLALAEGRETAYLAVHVHRGSSDAEVFRELSAVMGGYDARPHWGKLHPLDHAELATLYPRMDRVRSLRESLDPDGTFLNEYRRRVLGIDGVRT